MKQTTVLNFSVTHLSLIHILSLVSVCAKGSDVVGPSTQRIFKRNEVDLPFCVENFDIHEDTIIRTQDSRRMGAKYINETDLSSREECLKLCCETTSCDVFVFEEKNPGSCYLFNCGPSDDFKCKFDQHTQYTSAILAISRHAAELESEIQHSKHEQELTRLRALPNEMAPSTPSSPDIISTIPPAPKEATHPVLTVNTTLTKPVGESVVGSAESVAYAGGNGGESSDAAPAPSSRREKCSRYQFECRSTGECIAIYNACDGIPQCADGSDEGSELDCPSAASTSPLAHPRGQEETGHLHNHPHQQQKVAAVSTAGTHPVTSPPSPQIASQSMSHHIPPAIEGYLPARGLHNQQLMPSAVHQVPGQPQQFQPNWAEQQQQQQQLPMQTQYHSMSSGYGGEGEARPPQYPAQHLQQPQTHMGYQGEGFPVSSSGDLRERPQPSQGSGQWPSLRPGQALPPSPLGQDWFPHQANDGGNLGPRYEESGQSRHIFNHKGNGLVADTDRYIHMRSHLNQYNIPYGESNQGDYNSYANVGNKNFMGSSENYFSTPYRQPAQPNWPLLHQKMASNGDLRQMSEPVKDPREDIARKHVASPSSIQGLPLPNSAHGDYPPSMHSASSGDQHPAGVPIPPDYFYEDNPSGGQHTSISSPHRGNNYQRVDPSTSLHAQEQKAYGGHHDNFPAQHLKQKVLPKEGAEMEGEEEEESTEISPEEGGGHDGSVQHEKSIQHKKTTTTPKPAANKQTSSQHQSPVHMSLQHANPQTNEEDSSDVPDGESSRPKGAVLSLTLGMGITAIMVALMAWRLRVIKRRLRRGGGKSPYAHDADYLLNGMYL